MAMTLLIVFYVQYMYMARVLYNFLATLAVHMLYSFKHFETVFFVLFQFHLSI